MSLSRNNVKINFIGFLSALLWPFLIALNLFFLAPIFELFLPVGERVKTLLGTYYQGALFAGVLFALSQSFLGLCMNMSNLRKRRLEFSF